MHSQKVGTGTKVHFRLHDVVCPDWDRLVNNIGPELALQGEIIFLSDHGEERDHFAIIEVPGMKTPVIVPMSMLGASDELSNGDESA